MSKKDLPVREKITLAFFISELEGEYANSLCRELVDVARGNGVNLILFPGKTLQAPYQYQYQHNVIFDLASPVNVDGILFATGVLCNYITSQELVEFMDKFKKLPRLSLSVPVNGVPAVLIDNKSGLYETVVHLIEKHGRRRIAFLKGRENHPEAEERFQAYKAALKDKNIDFDENLVMQGDFTMFSVSDALKSLLEDRQVTFDAVVSANDEMALKVLEILQKKNIKVPEMVSVTGFDNIDASRFSSPPLTTVRQPYTVIIKHAFDMLMTEIREGKKLKNKTFQTVMTVRDSCGCLSQNISSISTKSSVEPEFTLSDKDYEIALNGFLEAEKDIITSFDLGWDDIERYITRMFHSLIRDRFTEDDSLRLVLEFNQRIKGNLLDDKEFTALGALLSRARNGIIPLIGSVQRKDAAEDFFHKVRTLLFDKIQRQNEARWDLHHTDIRLLREVLNTMISNINERSEALNHIIKQLRAMDIRSCYIYLYEKEIVHQKSQKWQKPGKVYLAMAYDDNRTLTESHRKKFMKTDEILCNTMLPKDRFLALLVAPLFFMEEQIGLIVCEYNERDNYLFESLFTEISCTLKLSTLIKTQEQIEARLRNALRELEEYNELLSKMSKTDELTGLYNRRGFLAMAHHSMELAARMSKNGVLFYADLDGLKSINDQYGHEEGDHAIIQTAGILRNTFRNADIIARLGGDEFVVLTINTSLPLVKNLTDRLQELIDEYNENSGKPYHISISMGAVSFISKDSVTIEELMSKADMLLYDQKRRKKKTKNC